MARDTEQCEEHKAHPYPSGVAEPSRADELITTRLRDALSLVDVRVLDHIVAGGDTVSLAEKGLLCDGIGGLYLIGASTGDCCRSTIKATCLLDIADLFFLDRRTMLR